MCLVCDLGISVVSNSLESKMFSFGYQCTEASRVGWNVSKLVFSSWKDSNCTRMFEHPQLFKLLRAKCDRSI